MVSVKSLENLLKSYTFLKLHRQTNVSTGICNASRKKVQYRQSEQTNKSIH